MIVRLTGMVDGSYIVFTRLQGDKWETVVPLDLDGEYVVELTAYDDAGNIAYVTTMLFTVDPTALCISMMPVSYSVDCRAEAYAAERQEECYKLNIVQRGAVI